MTKHELLVPAGDMDCLYQAIANGADAVYLGCKSFGARKFAKNFDNEEIVTAIKYAHLYDTKVYVTMNTLVKDEEVPAFLEQVEYLHKNGVDALIIQDFGMICLLREMYPNLEIHASTQANTSSQATAELFYKLGVKRVVFSREMSIEEINSIDIPIEKEVFIHGALCISYSGCCLMSSMLGTRSGNRGECAGSCRLPYILEKSGKKLSQKKYLLSTKELNTAPKIKSLLSSNITSFKIEGRMKSQEYVGFITKFYRALIDHKEFNLTEETEKLKTIFNREFTKGNLFNETAPELMNTNTPNHIGLEIGKVIEVTPQKIKIKLNHPLNQQDGIRFLNSGKGFIVNFLYDEKDNLVNSATDVCYVDNKVNLTENDIVCKTQNYKLLSELKKIPTKKIPITYSVKAKVNEPLQVTISDGINTVIEYGSIIENSISSPVSKERIQEQLEKLGTTPFISKKTDVTMDNSIFISIKKLNDIRRTLVDKLIYIRENKKTNFFKKTPSFDKVLNYQKEHLTVSVSTKDQLQACLELNILRIYVEDEELYELYKEHKNIFYKIPRCSREPQNKEKSNNLVSDYYFFNKEKNYVTDYPLNVSNIYTVYYLNKLNVKIITPSVELTETELNNMIIKYENKFCTKPNLELFSYGRVENMIIKGNILNLETNVHEYTLVDFKNRSFPVYFDGINTHILNYENKFITSPELLSKVSCIRLYFYNETKQDVINIVKKYL